MKNSKTPKMEDSVRYVLLECKGCCGSQRWNEIREYDTMSEAEEAAYSLNEHCADGVGKSYEDYMEDHDLNPEGLYCASEVEGDADRLTK